MTAKQLESIQWAEQCIKGNQRGKGEINHLVNLIQLIAGLQYEVDMMKTKLDDFFAMERMKI